MQQSEICSIFFFIKTLKDVESQIRAYKLLNHRFKHRPQPPPTTHTHTHTKVNIDPEKSKIASDFQMLYKI